MKALPIIQVDAFTTTLYGGNPCAVVFEADGLSPAQMQIIAREMNLSETAFVLESRHADFRARYFTPAEEVPLAGHPTIATVYGLLSSGRLRRDTPTTISLELEAGVIEVHVDGEAGTNPLINMTQLRPEFLASYDRESVASVLGLAPEDLHPHAVPQTVSTGTPQLMVPLASLDALSRLHLHVPEYAELRQFGDFFSLHAFVTQGVTDRGDTFARHFGVPPDMREDSFTGSATGGMAAYLCHHGLIERQRFVAEQGHWMDRPGEAEVEVLGERDDIRGVRVGGHAVEVLEGMILVP